MGPGHATRSLCRHSGSTTPSSRVSSQRSNAYTRPHNRREPLRRSPCLQALRCSPCQHSRSTTPAVLRTTWPPNSPWRRIEISVAAFQTWAPAEASPAEAARSSEAEAVEAVRVVEVVEVVEVAEASKLE